MPTLRDVLLPQRVLAAALALAALVVATAITLATGQAAVGISLAIDGEQVVIAAAPSEMDLPPGTPVVALKGNGQRLPLAAVDLTPEPDMAFTRYSDMDVFFDRQRGHAALQQAADAALVLADGREVPLSGEGRRPLGNLPFVFWFQILCAVGGLLAGASVLAFRWQDPTTRYYALTGVGMLMFASSAAIYSTRELAIDGTLFMALSSINEFGALLFCGGLIAVLWYYPTRLAAFNAGPWIIAAYVGFGLSIPLRLHDSVEALAHLPISLGYLSTYGLAAVQWWRTRGDPFQRAALRAFLLAWLFGSGAFVAVMVLPAMAGIDNGAIQGYAFGFFLLIYAGIAVGVLRYQLFRLDRWWFAAWGLFFGGLGVIALDLLFVYLLRIDGRTSLLVSLAIAGWLYFPLRQWLWGLFNRRRVRAHAPALVGLVTDALSDRDQPAADAWKALLGAVFSPLSTATAAVETDAIVDSGLSLEVAPASTTLPGLRLQYAERGQRLFQSEDLRLLAELRRLFDEIRRYRGLLEEGVQRERDRVARDLHDDVGARLLTLSHQLPGEHAEQARRALEELRAVVYSMQTPPTPFDALLGQWRAEVAERCEAAEVTLAWTVSGPVPDHVLGGGAVLALSRVLRECVSNALRHCPQAPQLTVDLTCSETQLTVVVAHAYQGPAATTWQPSVGLNNLHERLRQMSGHIEWHTDDSSSRLTARWQVPWGQLLALD